MCEKTTGLGMPTFPVVQHAVGGGCWLPSGVGEQHACRFCGSGGAVEVRWHVAAAVRCLAEALEYQGFVPRTTGLGSPIPEVQHAEDDAYVFTAGTHVGGNSAPAEHELEAAKGWCVQTSPLVGLMCEQTTGSGMQASLVVQADVGAEVGGVAEAVQCGDGLQQVAQVDTQVVGS